MRCICFASCLFGVSASVSWGQPNPYCITGADWRPTNSRMVTLGMPAVGAIIIGGVAEHLGLHIATLGAGVICLIGWVWIRLRLKVMAPALETHPD